MKEGVKLFFAQPREVSIDSALGDTEVPLPAIAKCPGPRRAAAKTRRALFCRAGEN